MTGRGQHGGPPGRDHWRRGRDDSPRDGEPTRRAPEPRNRELFSTWVEVEELPTQSLASRPRARVPLTGLIAVAGIAALLAVGFGYLGGGLGGGAVAPPSLATQAADLPTMAPASPTDAPVPRVTPWTSCATTSKEPPQPVLEVDGRQHAAQVEVLELDVDPTVDSLPGLRGGDPLEEPVEVPMDAVTEIWIAGGSCAVAWNIALVGPSAPETQVLESVGNEARDPAVTAQNRFQVFVAPYAGRHLLRAVLVLEDVAVRATWAIHVPTLAPPDVTLTGESGAISTAVGCDVIQRLVNDWEERLSPCNRDVSREPTPRADVGPDETLEFSIAGWAARSTTVVCGQLTDRIFQPIAGVYCASALDPLYAGVRFTIGDLQGPVTLAFTTCASRIRITGNGFEELCGTWYANIRVGE